MMKRIFIIPLLIISLQLNAQINLLIEGVDSTTTTHNGYEIARESQTNLIFRYNKISTALDDGFMLMAGDNDYNSNATKLDGAQIYGNSFISTNTTPSGSLHGVMAGYNENYDFHHNYISSYSYGFTHEGGFDDHTSMTNALGGIYYNIFKNNILSINEKGFDGTRIVNNTFYSDIDSWGAFITLCNSNTGGFTEPYPPTKNVTIKNNIFYVGGTDVYHAIYIVNEADTLGLECDYNIYFYEHTTNNEPLFSYKGANLTWTQWRALGYDEHSIIVDPDFIDFNDFVPTARLDYGTEITGFENGFSSDYELVVGEAPSLTAQSGTWQVGAVIYEAPPSLTAYYVSTTGNDSNPGTLSQPWATWRKAFQTAAAGDTVYFRGGTYPYDGLGNLWVSNSGTHDNPICFFNYPNESPLLDFSNRYNTSYGYMLEVGANRNYIHLKGLTFCNMLQSTNVCVCGITGYSNVGVIFENMIVYNVGGPGYSLGGVDSLTFINCDTYNCYDPYNAGGNGDGFQVNNIGKRGLTTFIGCRAWRCSDDGFDNYRNDGIVNYINCWAMACGYPEGDGNGFKLGLTTISALESTQRNVTRCIAVDNRMSGFNENRGIIFMNIYNNFSYRNGSYGNFWDAGYVNFGDGIVNGAVYSNNISYLDNNPYYWPQSNRQISTSNSWSGGVTVTADDFISLDTAQLYGPRKADGSLPDITFGKLASTSDLIDGGIDVGLPYSGAAPDLGYSEFYNKKAVFIHHSSGGNWVADAWGGLGKAMNDAGYFFSGVDYGWDAPYNTDIGDYTDIGDWWTWFMDQTVQGNGEARRDNIMGAVYTEYDKDIQFGDYTRTLSDPGGENEIIVFKSCYPNSDILADNSTTPIDIYGDPAGSSSYTETNVRALYDTILTYFKANPGRMFVVITAPPLSAATNAARARSFNNWLVNNWLQDADWENKNVYVWDWYNVLTGVNNHHRVEDGVVVHTIASGSGNVAIDAYIDGDDHPNEAGCQKSTTEFVPVLNVWYSTWSNFSTPTEEPVASTATDILTFTLADQTAAATINTANHTVAIEVDYTADITDLTPTITLSYGATVIPASGVSRDFTNPVPYTVTAEDGITIQEWVVTVTQDAAPPVDSTGRIVKFGGKIMKR